SRGRRRGCAVRRRSGAPRRSACRERRQGSDRALSMRDLAERAVDAARAAGAIYADVRLVRRRREEIRADGDRGLPIRRIESEACGLRGLVSGAWGFAASPGADPDRMAQAARDACEAAREARRVAPAEVALAPEPPHLDAWQTPLTQDPFKVSA